ncbi:MAG: lipocalin family protein [Saprospiraceae bacterium]|uniref:Lipocalin family protein n=1 Tax=Candidatus Opimibacter skivensis TaxID=2982028 RepID=A0A9D7SWW7_9BACT|nr:lipocalin family protein [Candidatus Opimibacter skivensis]
MKFNRSIFLLIALISLLFSCEAGKQNKMILGKWTGIEWLVDGHASSHTPGEAVFTFNEDGIYSFEYAGNVENGKYYVNNNELFTTPEGGIKMMVKIPKLTQDTLIFDMNRGGQSEKLTLIRN